MPKGLSSKGAEGSLVLLVAPCSAAPTQAGGTFRVSQSSVWAQNTWASMGRRQETLGTGVGVSFLSLVPESLEQLWRYSWGRRKTPGQRVGPPSCAPEMS